MPPTTRAAKRKEREDEPGPSSREKSATIKECNTTLMLFQYTKLLKEFPETENFFKELPDPFPELQEHLYRVLEVQGELLKYLFNGEFEPEEREVLDYNKLLEESAKCLVAFQNEYAHRKLTDDETEVDTEVFHWMNMLAPRLKLTFHMPQLYQQWNIQSRADKRELLKEHLTGKQKMWMAVEKYEAIVDKIEGLKTLFFKEGLDVTNPPNYGNRVTSDDEED